MNHWKKNNPPNLFTFRFTIRSLIRIHSFSPSTARNHNQSKRNENKIKQPTIQWCSKHSTELFYPVIKGHSEKGIHQKLVIVFSPISPSRIVQTSDRPIKPYRPRTFLQTCQQGSLCNLASEFRLEPFEIGRPLIPIFPPFSLSLFFLHPFHGYVTTAWETNAIDKRGGARKN